MSCGRAFRDIEFLADPTAGALTIGYTLSIGDTLLPQIVEQFSEKHPRVVMQANIVPTPSFKFPGLRDRTYDLILTRIPAPIPDDDALNDLNVEVLFDDPWVIVACMNSRWARRRKSRSRRACRWALAHAAAGYIELQSCSGGIQSARSRHADGHAGDLFDGTSREIVSRWPVRHRCPEIRTPPWRRPARVERAAYRHANAAMAGCDLDPEKPNLEPGGRAFHRMRARDR